MCFNQCKWAAHAGASQLSSSRLSGGLAGSGSIWTRSSVCAASAGDTSRSFQSAANSSSCDSSFFRRACVAGNGFRAGRLQMCRRDNQGNRFSESPPGNAQRARQGSMHGGLLTCLASLLPPAPGAAAPWLEPRQPAGPCQGCRNAALLLGQNQSCSALPLRPSHTCRFIVCCECLVSANAPGGPMALVGQPPCCRPLCDTAWRKPFTLVPCFLPGRVARTKRA